MECTTISEYVYIGWIGAIAVGMIVGVALVALVGHMMTARTNRELERELTALDIRWGKEHSCQR